MAGVSMNDNTIKNRWQQLFRILIILVTIMASTFKQTFAFDNNSSLLTTVTFNGEDIIKIDGNLNQSYTPASYDKGVNLAPTSVTDHRGSTNNVLLKSLPLNPSSSHSKLLDGNEPSAFNSNKLVLLEDLSSYVSEVYHLSHCKNQNQDVIFYAYGADRKGVIDLNEILNSFEIAKGIRLQADPSDHTSNQIFQSMIAQFLEGKTQLNKNCSDSDACAISLDIRESQEKISGLLKAFNYKECLDLGEEKPKCDCLFKNPSLQMEDSLIASKNIKDFLVSSIANAAFLNIDQFFSNFSNATILDELYSDESSNVKCDIKEFISNPSGHKGDNSSELQACISDKNSDQQKIIVNYFENNKKDLSRFDFADHLTSVNFNQQGNLNQALKSYLTVRQSTLKETLLESVKKHQPADQVIQDPKSVLMALNQIRDEYIKRVVLEVLEKPLPTTPSDPFSDLDEIFKMNPLLSLVHTSHDNFKALVQGAIVAKDGPIDPEEVIKYIQKLNNDIISDAISTPCQRAKENMLNACRLLKMAQNPLNGDISQMNKVYNEINDYIKKPDFFESKKFLAKKYLGEQFNDSDIDMALDVQLTTLRCCQSSREKSLCQMITDVKSSANDIINQIKSLPRLSSPNENLYTPIKKSGKKTQALFMNPNTKSTQIKPVQQLIAGWTTALEKNSTIITRNIDGKNIITREYPRVSYNSKNNTLEVPSSSPKGLENYSIVKEYDNSSIKVNSDSGSSGPDPDSSLVQNDSVSVPSSVSSGVSNYIDKNSAPSDQTAIPYAFSQDKMVQEYSSKEQEQLKEIDHIEEQLEQAMKDQSTAENDIQDDKTSEIDELKQDYEKLKQELIDTRKQLTEAIANKSQIPEGVASNDFSSISNNSLSRSVASNKGPASTTQAPISTSTNYPSISSGPSTTNPLYPDHYSSLKAAATTNSSELPIILISKDGTSITYIPPNSLGYARAARNGNEDATGNNEQASQNSSDTKFMNFLKEEDAQKIAKDKGIVIYEQDELKSTEDQERVFNNGKNSTILVRVKEGGDVKIIEWKAQLSKKEKFIGYRPDFIHADPTSRYVLSIRYQNLLNTLKLK